VGVVTQQSTDQLVAFTEYRAAKIMIEDLLRKMNEITLRLSNTAPEKTNGLINNHARK